MKKTGRLLVLLTVLSLLVSMFPAAVADTYVTKEDISTIDTVPTEIKLPSEYVLGKYFWVDDTCLQKAKFTAPETGTYYFYERREDKVVPMIQIYTQENDPLPNGTLAGTSGGELVMPVYLKKGYSYFVNFNFTLTDTSTQLTKGIFIGACLPSKHMEPSGTWVVTLKPTNGKYGKKVQYCDFCHQIAVSTNIPSIPWKLNIKGIKYNSVKVKWSAAEGATKYEVYRRKNSSSKKAKLIGTTTKTYFTATGLEVGRKYYFQVKAITPYGTSDLSEMVLGIPTLKAPSSVKGSSPSSGTVKLTWKKRNKANGYFIYRAVSPGGPYEKIKTVSGGSKTSVTVGAAKGRTLYYKVAAYMLRGKTKVACTQSPAVKVTVKK